MNLLVILIWLISILIIHLLLVRIIYIYQMYEDLRLSVNTPIQKEYIQNTSDENHKDNKDNDFDEMFTDLTEYVESQKLFSSPTSDSINVSNVPYGYKPLYDVPVEQQPEDMLSKKIKIPNLAFNDKLTTDRKNITINESIPNQLVINSEGNELYSFLNDDNWKYNNENIENGGSQNGLMAYDEVSYDYAPFNKA